MLNPCLHNKKLTLVTGISITIFTEVIFASMANIGKSLTLVLGDHRFCLIFLIAFIKCQITLT